MPILRLNLRINPRQNYLNITVFSKMSPESTQGQCTRPGRCPHRRRWSSEAPLSPNRPDILILPPTKRPSGAPMRPRPHWKWSGTTGPPELSPENIGTPFRSTFPRNPPSSTYLSDEVGCRKNVDPLHTSPGSPGICPCKKRQ